jgi:NADP-dependent aldehyde dehydrogenase
MFAAVVRAGDFIGVRIDPALPERKPMPRADLRLRNLALGPVAVFGASNFPLAFSVAGGDTASALAAGCPVIVKAHSAHPGTSELVGLAVQRAVNACDMPEGTFSLLFGSGREIGQGRVKDHRIKAVGFTGSRGAGTDLISVAAACKEPIPVYAEMSSINPVLLFPSAPKNRAEAIGKAFVQSLVLGAGQFCTNPGLILAVDGPDLDRFAVAAAAALEETPASTMMTPGIHQAYEGAVAKAEAHTEVQTLARGGEPASTNQEFLNDGGLTSRIVVQMGRTRHDGTLFSRRLAGRDLGALVAGASRVGTGCVRCGTNIAAPGNCHESPPVEPRGQTVDRRLRRNARAPLDPLSCAVQPYAVLQRQRSGTRSDR